MRFICTLPPDLKKTDTIILPISMNQPLERGERLAAILQSFEECGYKKQVTILVCDYLNRHNCTNDQDALKQGDQFIQENKDSLKDYPIIRWKPFLDSRPQNQFSNYFNTILNQSSEGSKFYNKMKKTWEKCLSSSQSLEASINYQMEEYASILCMNEFDHLFYPKRITNGLAYLYNYIEGKKPIYHHIKVAENKIKNANPSAEFFMGSLKENRNHIHIAFRGLLEHMELLLSSSELSLKSKKTFAEEVENLFMAFGLLNDLSKNEKETTKNSL
ncbi:MAG: hypothetical protein H0U70_00485 [Tatlockia sp.]|nr:hypothetical protein [Tatlockia sp.]